ncbi:hypothetical protein RclHR1_05530004 [Rhizophagus clarus]|uniref:MADF domain-containing protein n=1 Tax=Rhizophagus clarus TaxID=94130 RepID=A0A2Z6S083_9GLOM|nr:hypothetical protein RclHR1_05530004 [Rhizophagus clarus]GET03688.1 hypothetical protein GLOIN_2v1880292 [Rhizophagus clarus]
MNEMKLFSYVDEINYMEPLINKVNHGPFSDDEKNYVHNWVIRQSNYDVIRWEYLQIEIQKEYGKFRLRNDLRNIWNRIRRQNLRRDSIDENDETPQ